MKAVSRKIILLFCGLFFLPLFLFSGCDYARMNNDEAVDTYQMAMPDMPQQSVPTDGGLNELLSADLSKLKNPLPDKRDVIVRGADGYSTFCRQCHGPYGRGYGTVGQSFTPLPTNLLSDYVQNQSDGLIFYRTSIGFKRHPPLYYTVSVSDRWAIIRYIRFLSEKQATF